MAKMIVNDFEVNGKLSFDRTVNDDKTGFVIQGVLSTHLYFEEIKAISTYRYTLRGIEVLKESFGSDDFNIYYHFIAKDLEIKGTAYADGVSSILYPEEIGEIEGKMYENDHPMLGDIGEEYKDIYSKDNEEEGKEE